MIPNIVEFERNGRCQEGQHLYDPVTIAAVAFQAFGKIQEGRAAKQSADDNAAVSRQNAERVRQQTEAQKETQDRERRLRLGANIAAGGASGVGIESFGDVLSSSAMQEELDLLTLESEGLLRSRDFETQAELQKLQGRQALSSSIIGAGSTVLGGVSDYMNLNKDTSPLYTKSKGGMVKPGYKPLR